MFPTSLPLTLRNPVPPTKAVAARVGRPLSLRAETSVMVNPLSRCLKTVLSQETISPLHHALI
jgi:hypothetical protein